MDVSGRRAYAAGMTTGRIRAIPGIAAADADSDVEARCELSVIIPLHNEEDNVEPLWAELREVLDAAGCDYEVIFVDDGSTDRTLQRLRAAVGGHPRVTIIELRRNFGQTAAMAAGFDHAVGRVAVPMDGDMQNDPRDIPALLARLDEPPGYDVVSGWRRDRKDRALSRRLPSRLANWIIGYATGVRIHDYGCTLKAYRREVLRDVHLYSEMHRFLPALARWEGARVTEMVVHHRPRTRGQSKYGLKRTFSVLLDLVTVKFLGGYVTKPLYFFGKLAVWAFGLAAAVLAVAILQRFAIIGDEPLHLNRNVLVLLASLLAIMGAQMLAVGVVADLIARTYFESQRRPTYRVRRIERCGRTVRSGEPAREAV